MQVGTPANRLSEGMDHFFPPLNRAPVTRIICIGHKTKRKTEVAHNIITIIYDHNGTKKRWQTPSTRRFRLR